MTRNFNRNLCELADLLEKHRAELTEPGLTQVSRTIPDDTKNKIIRNQLLLQNIPLLEIW